MHLTGLGRAILLVSSMICRVLVPVGGRKSWCESNDPKFATKAAEVVGLYMAPPKNAVVERAQGYLKLPNGRALEHQTWVFCHLVHTVCVTSYSTQVLRLS